MFSFPRLFLFSLRWLLVLALGLGSAEAATKKSKKPTVRRAEPVLTEPTPPPRPSDPGRAPSTRAAAVIVVDATTGEVLYEKNADELRPAASTQKLLTGLLVAERGYLDERVVVHPTDTYAEPSKLYIKAGDSYRRLELLRALLVKSSNDVARCLARDHSGSVDRFAAAMNRRARELGAFNSNFVNPNGLPSPGQYSTARDLARIARAAYANPTIRSIVKMPKMVFRFANGRTRELENTNKVLRRFAYCNGMKTGYTNAAGYCLISSATRPGGREVIAVVLGNSKASIWKDSAALLAWGIWL